MLTPLGAGASRSRPRRWPRVLGVLVALAVVGTAAYGAWWWTSQREADDADGATASPTVVCTTPTPEPPRRLPEPVSVTVAVANGTDRAGLALDTADELAARGFGVGDIGNTGRPVKTGVAVVRYAPADLGAAVSLAAYLPGATLQPTDQVRGADVAMWLGPEFDGLVTTGKADPDAVVLPAGEPRCRKQR